MLSKNHCYFNINPGFNFEDRFLSCISNKRISISHSFYGKCLNDKFFISRTYGLIRNTYRTVLYGKLTNHHIAIWFGKDLLNIIALVAIYLVSIMVSAYMVLTSMPMPDFEHIAKYVAFVLVISIIYLPLLFYSSKEKNALVLQLLDLLNLKELKYMTSLSTEECLSIIPKINDKCFSYTEVDGKFIMNANEKKLVDSSKRIRSADYSVLFKSVGQKTIIEVNYADSLRKESLFFAKRSDFDKFFKTYFDASPTI